jgi:FixJ family two-component response regulator
MAGVASWFSIVDDDPSVLKALARLLRTHGFHAKTFGSARAFLDALSDDLPECLIVDLQMPQISGLELRQRLRLRGIEIPTIIITAHDNNGLRQRCGAAGIVAYLLKPIREVTLLAAIAEARAPATPAPFPPVI